jgi:ATP-binding cassette subfamily B protein/subfamily B ATP-binding cassette protein MsbA
MSTPALLRMVVRRMRPHLGRLAFAILGVVLAAGLEVLKPWPLKIVIDNVLRGAPLAGAWVPARALDLAPTALLAWACLGLVALYLMLGLVSVFNNYVSISIGQRMVNELRAEMFDHLQRLSLSFHRRRGIGDLMVRIAYDAFSVQQIAMNGLFPLLSSTVMLVAMFCVMVRIDTELTLAALLVVPLLAILIAAASRPIERLAALARVKESRLYTVAHRSLAAIHVVQAFTREAESYREFVESSSDSLGETLRLYTLQTMYAGAVNVLIAIGTAAVIYIGARHVLDGRLTIGDLIVFATYLASLYAPINQMFQTYGLVQAAAAGLRRCLELLEIEPEIKDHPGARALGRAGGDVEFANVVFAYQAGHPVLKGVSFRARRGETVAIVGPSGAGKTTMASLLVRFYEPQAGEVRIDGHDAANFTLESLRRNVAMVLQPPLVLYDTMRANIALGRPGASAHEIERAASLARLDPVIARLPNGLDEVVGPGGHSLSEGEAQRVTIARALLRDAPILVMDEPTSALDAETEALVLAAVREAMRGRTTLVIAHRLSTIQNADRILVLRDGQIAEQGTFGELLSQGGFFGYLYNLQSWGREAAG